MQTAEFSAGVFQVLQSRKRSSRGLTELRLKGSSFRSCGRPRGTQAESSRRAAHPAPARQRQGALPHPRPPLIGDRAGTKWTVTDRCDGTVTTVTRGRVAVRDFRRRRTIVVRAGKRYLARAKR